MQKLCSPRSQIGINWRIRRLLYGFISRGGVQATKCADGCSLCRRKPFDASSPFVQVRLINAIIGEEESRDSDWSIRLAGDIVSKANSFAWSGTPFLDRTWLYVLSDTSLSRKSVGELSAHGDELLSLYVLKSKFNAAAVKREIAAPPLDD